MVDNITNPCIRCGKQRIVVKTWREYINKSLLIHTSTACPDAACQKIVDKQLVDRKEKLEAAEQERVQRSIAHKLASKNRTNGQKGSALPIKN